MVLNMDKGPSVKTLTFFFLVVQEIGGGKSLKGRNYVLE